MDLFPDGMVRIVFFASIGGGNEIPLTAEDLDAAEDIFTMCGLMPGEAAVLRRTLNATTSPLWIRTLMKRLQQNFSTKDRERGHGTRHEGLRQRDAPPSKPAANGGKGYSFVSR